MPFANYFLYGYAGLSQQMKSIGVFNGESENILYLSTGQISFRLSVAIYKGLLSIVREVGIQNQHPSLNSDSISFSSCICIISCNIHPYPLTSQTTISCLEHNKVKTFQLISSHRKDETFDSAIMERFYA